MFQNAIEVLSSEKSFVIIAPSAAVAEEWVSNVAEAKSKLSSISASDQRSVSASIDKSAATSQRILLGSNSAVVDEIAVAPVWVPDKENSGCIVCSAVRLTLLID